MRYGSDHKAAARERIVGAAGRGFRRFGYGGIGVDGLAKEAGLTSGAFYGHFGSKAEAFAAAAVAGLVELRGAVAALQAERGVAWLDAFVDFYVTTKRTCEPGESCGLQALTPEVARSERETRRAYQDELVRLVDVVADGLSRGNKAARRKLAWSILATLSGGVTLARAVDDEKVGAQVAAALRSAVATLVA